MISIWGLFAVALLWALAFYVATPIVWSIPVYLGMAVMTVFVYLAFME